MWSLTTWRSRLSDDDDDDSFVGILDEKQTEEEEEEEAGWIVQQLKVSSERRERQYSQDSYVSIYGVISRITEWVCVCEWSI